MITLPTMDWPTFVEIPGSTWKAVFVTSAVLMALFAPLLPWKKNKSLADPPLLEPGPQTDPPLLTPPPLEEPPLPFPKLIPLQFDFWPHAASTSNEAETISNKTICFVYLIQLSLPKNGGQAILFAASRPPSEN